MKIRSGFVSNSSSSSFILRIKNLTVSQYKSVKSPVPAGRKFGLECCEDAEDWSITEDTEYIRGNTIMDNFSMSDLFEKLKIPKSEYAFDNGYNGVGPGDLGIDPNS